MKEQKRKWDIKSRAKVVEVRNSLRIRLDDSIVKLMRLKKGQAVKIYPESKNRLIIEI